MKYLYIWFMLAMTMALNGQQTITGKVMDDAGDILIGATVIERGTTNGVITDFEGMYEITVSGPGAVLLVSYTGYREYEGVVGESNNMDITLSPGITLGDIQIVGSRSYNRTATNSPVAVDVIDVAEVANQSGKVEINQIMQYAAPSFNATKQSGSDGADHIDPASLRGLGPDQTLVLINGKRRHQSSLINVFGTRGRGNTGTDLNAIPASAIKRIEVLRDGASAQYGSDAIAGVINIVLKDKTDGVTGGITRGAYKTDSGIDYAQRVFDEQDGWDPELFNVAGKNRLDGEDKSFDGVTTKVDLNYGIGLGDDGGYANFTAEYLTKDRTLRPGFSWRKGYGSAAADQFQFMVNAAMPLGQKTELYAFGGKGNRDTDAFAFSRSAPGPDGDSRSVSSLYPNGFTPHITSVIKDNSATAGIRHDMDNGWNVDFSHSYGANNFHYFITGTNNASLGSASPTNFDAGGHSLGTNVTNLNFTKLYDEVMSGLNFAFGAEYRTENFKIFAGEESSYATYDVNGVAITNPAVQDPFVNEFGQQPSGGSQGFPGYSPANEVDRNRSNFGLYADVELNTSEQFLLAGAVRFENYSDFGSTLNGKLAARLQASEQIALRASVSTGFRAPSLAQIHYNLLFNNIVAGRSLRTLLASNTSNVAKAFEIGPLQEEKATNMAAGLTYKSGAFTATIDGYMINVDDRIILTDVFDATALDVGAEAAQFFANGVDTRTTGIDIVLNYKLDLGAGDLGLGIAGNFNNTEIQNINSGDLNQFTFFGPFSQAYLEAAAPDHKFTFNATYSLGKFDANLGVTKFSTVTLQDFQWVDTPATTQAEANALFDVATDTYSGKFVTDLSLGYNITNGLKITLGANNLFNVYPDIQTDGWTDQGGFNDSVQMGSDGAYFFGRIGFNF